jgi:hypothetical protein
MFKMFIRSPVASVLPDCGKEKVLQRNLIDFSLRFSTRLKDEDGEENEIESTRGETERDLMCQAHDKLSFMRVFYGS